MPLGWDDLLPDTLLSQWQQWRNSLHTLEKVSVPRCYHPVSFGKTARREIHAFSDASKDSVGACIYLCLLNEKKGDLHTLGLWSVQSGARSNHEYSPTGARCRCSRLASSYEDHERVRQPQH